MRIYDLIVIGSGPAGVTAAKIASSKGMSTLIIERGKDINRRRDLTSGWFGHGLYTMNRLELEDHLFSNRSAIKNAYRIICQVASEIPKIVEPRSGTPFCVLPATIGKELAEYFLSSISGNVDVVFNSDVELINKNGRYFIVQTSKDMYTATRCLLATGKNSIEWTEDICEKFGLTPIKNSIKVGIRIEIPTFRANEVLHDIGDIRIDCGNNIKVEDARIDSFVGEWEDSRILSAFGHGMHDKQSDKTNFMMGEDSSNIEESLREVRIVNVLGNDKIKPGRVREFLNGESILEHLRVFSKIKKSFSYLERFFPTIANYAIMYAPEVKLRGIIPVNRYMETKIEKLYGAGECTDKVSTLIGAMASGIVAARTILKK
jgi:uncharacterized FAD-dependent dehydrogenase